MAISSETYKTTYTGDGSTTTFSFGFRILQASDLKVTKYTIADGTTDVLTLTSDYTVSGVDGASGGSITLTGTAPSSLYKIILTRDIDYTQDTDWVENDPFLADTIEDAVDRLTMLTQQLKEQIDRTVLQDLAASSQITFPTASSAGYFYYDGSDYSWTTGTTGISDITQIDSSIRSGSDTTLITGTAGTAGTLTKWDSNGDAIEGGRQVYIKVIANDTALATGDGKAYFTVPSELDGLDLTDADAAVYTASSSGTPTVQIHNLTDTVDMLSTAITIDETEYSSYTAETAPVIDTSNDDVATGDIIRCDVDSAGTDTTGLDIILVFS